MGPYLSQESSESPDPDTFENIVFLGSSKVSFKLTSSPYLICTRYSNALFKTADLRIIWECVQPLYKPC